MTPNAGPACSLRHQNTAGHCAMAPPAGMGKELSPGGVTRHGCRHIPRGHSTGHGRAERGAQQQKEQQPPFEALSFLELPSDRFLDEAVC